MKFLKEFWMAFIELASAIWKPALLGSAISIVAMVLLTAGVSALIGCIAPQEQAEDQAAQTVDHEESSDSVGDLRAAEGKIEQETVSRSDIPDTVLELHFMHKVFDKNYVGPYDDLVYPSTVTGRWLTWGEAYFDREVYRDRLEKEFSKYWSIGHWWWQMSVTVQCEKELTRGSPIRFTIDYPFVDFRDDLVYEVDPGDGGIDAPAKVSVQQGAFHAPRFGYPAAMVISLIVFALIAAIVFGIGMLLLKLWKLVVRLIARQLMPSDPDNVWVQRFAGFGLGAVLCVLISIINLFL